MIREDTQKNLLIGPLIGVGVKPQTKRPVVSSRSSLRTSKTSSEHTKIPILIIKKQITQINKYDNKLFIHSTWTTKQNHFFHQRKKCKKKIWTTKVLVVRPLKKTFFLVFLPYWVVAIDYSSGSFFTNCVFCFCFLYTQGNWKLDIFAVVLELHLIKTMYVKYCR